MAPRAPTPADRTFTPPRAIARVLRVIETLAHHARRMSLAELSSALGVPKTSLFAILKGLAEGGYVVFDDDAYVLGPAALKLGAAISGGRAFPESALPLLEQMGQASGETVILGTLSEDRRHVVYALVIETDSWLRFSVKVGTRRPLSVAASGHSILAYLPEAERERYLASGPFERITPRTVATAGALRKLVAKVRREHCAMTIDGTVAAATGVAAPYFGRDGAVVGAVLIAAPSERIAGREDEIKAQARAGGEAISRLLAYAGPYPP